MRAAQRGCTPGDHEKRSLLVNSGAEAVENAVKIARYATGRPAVIAFDQAFHGRTLLGMSLTAQGRCPTRSRSVRSRPRSTARRSPIPFRGTGGARRRRSRGSRRDRRRSANRVRRRRADRGRRRLRRARAGLARGARASGAAQRRRCSSPTRCRPGSGAPARGSRASTRASCPTSSRPAKGLGGGLPLGGVTGAPRSSTRCTSAGSAARSAATRCRARPRSRRSRPYRGRRARRAGAEASATACCRGCAAMQSTHDVIGDVRGRGAMVAIELVDPRTARPTRH